VLWLTLTGGEPTLDPAFDAILAVASRYRIAVKVSTNAWELPDSLLQAISSRVVMQVNVSLDGSDAATHDWFRRRQGSYTRVMRSLQSLYSTPPKMLVFNVSVHRRSLSQMEALTRVAIANAATAISFKPVVSTGRPGIRDDFTLSDAQVAEFKLERDRLRRLYGQHLQIDGKLLAEEIKPALLEPVACAAGEVAMFIDADGRMLPCESVAYVPNAPIFRDMTPMQAWMESPVFGWFRNVRTQAISRCGASGGCGSKGCPGTQAKDALRPLELIQLGL
jgi:MoaA/NifB/PqqE/SkfB family radical SAM enzyme